MLSLTFLFPVILSLFQTELVFFSGKSGDPIGSRVDVDVNGVFAHLQFHTSTGAPYLLLLTGVCLITASVPSSSLLNSSEIIFFSLSDSGLYAISMQRLLVRAKAGLKSVLKKDDSWEKKADGSTGFIPLYQYIHSCLTVMKTGLSRR